jgi:hypothetical protein
MEGASAQAGASSYWYPTNHIHVEAFFYRLFNPA